MDMEETREEDICRLALAKSQEKMGAQSSRFSHRCEMKLYLFLIVIFCSMHIGCKENEAPPPAVNSAVKSEPEIILTPEQLEEEIDRVTIDSIDLENIELEAALHFLAQRGSVNHPDHGFRFPFDFSGVNTESDVTISWIAENVTFREAITTICEKAGLNWATESGVISFSHRDRE